MSVTIIYQGAALTFPDIDDPMEAYRRLGVSPGGSSPAAGGTPSFSGTNIQRGTDPALLRENKDWLSASRVLFEGTQGKKWEGSDKDLAEWGLDRMARFNYNIMFSAVDTVSIRNAPDNQKKAFLYLLDNFDNIAYSWGGVGNFLKYVLKDPTTYVGLSTLGVGTAAARSAGFASKEAVKAALRTSAFGAIEGGIFGGVQQGLEQTARVNAGGQEEVDYGKVGLGALIGGAAGGVLAPALASGINRIRGRAVDAPATPGGTQVAPEATDAVSGLPRGSQGPSGEQLGLNLGDMTDPNAAAQVRMDRLQESGRAGSYMPGDDISSLPSARDAYQAVREPMLPLDLPVDPNRTLNTSTAVDLSQARVREDGSPMTTADLPFEGNVPGQSSADLLQPPSGPFAYDGQGRLFNESPTQVDTVQSELNLIAQKRATADALAADDARANKAIIDTLRKEADDQQMALDTRRYEEAMRFKRAVDDAVDSGLGPKEVRSIGQKIEQSTPFTPDMGIGKDNGPTITELLRLMRELGSKVDAEGVRAFKRLSDITDPLRRALLNMDQKQADEIIAQTTAAAKTSPELRAFTRAAIDASNVLGKYISDSLAESASAVTPFLKEQARDRALALENLLKPLRMLTRDPVSNAGYNLRQAQDSMFKGAKYRLEVDDILKKMGVDDPAKATPDQRADALRTLVDGVIETSEKVEKDTRVLTLRKRIADSANEDETIRLIQEMATLRQTIMDEERAANSVIQNTAASYTKVAGDVASYAAMAVLGPSSTVVNATSNALRTFSSPFLNYLSKGPLEKAAFREMLATYGAMRSVATRALRMGKQAFDLEKPLLMGTDSVWLEGHLAQYGKDAQNNVINFLGRNFIRVWMRLLNATDEVFGQMAYHGFVEGNAVYKALDEAAKKGLNKADEDALVKKYVEDALRKAYNTKPDASVYMMLMEAGQNKGYRGDELKLWVKNQIQNNADLYRRAANEEGIAYRNDLLFQTEFSGDNTASFLAKGYESLIRKRPELRIMGQLFFRTPVRVFEAGIRMTPVVQALAPKFLADVAGQNGPARQLRAHGELIASYGFTMAVATAFAAGKITGDGYGLDYREKRALENQGWRPYSIKIGDTWISYRNYDPFSTPVKIIVNALERLQMADYQKAQGVFEQKGLYKEVATYFEAAVGSTIQAVRDANLTAGIDDLVKFGEALADPERNEQALQQILASKAALAVPNSIRKGIRAFGEEQNVSNDPRTVEQALTSIFNPRSDTVTHQFDALGFKRTNMGQGFMAYIGLELADKATRERGLSEKDVYSLNEIAKMTYATGKRFIPTVKSPLYPDKDLREVTTADGGSTVYNKAMEVFNKNMPTYAYEFLKSTEDVPAGRRGEIAQRAKNFEQLQQNIWNAALQEVLYADRLAQQQRETKQLNKFDVLTGAREVLPSFR